MQWREYGIEQGELSCRETKSEISTVSCFTWGFSKSVGFTCISYWCPRKSMLVCARPHKLIKVYLFIFVPYKVTNSTVGLLVVFTTLLVTVMSNTKEELFIDINYSTPIFSKKKNYSNPIKRTKEPPYPCTTHVEVTQSYLFFAYLCPNKLSNFGQSYMKESMRSYSTWG
jgi:hypothetical protein